MSAKLPERIAERAQLPDVGGLVELFEVDARRIGGRLVRFAPGPFEGEPPEWGGVSYQPLPIAAEGFAWSGEGSPPRPTLRVGAVHWALVAGLARVDDWTGAEVRRLRTFARHLDGGSDPSGDAAFPTELWRIERMASQRRGAVTFELASPLDQEGVKLPRRQALRDACTHTYRTWDPAAGAFDYSGATCPYIGAALFGADGGRVKDGKDDACAKTLRACQRRFGERATLPIIAFPGVGAGR